jgi:hypothetical protein
LTDRPPLEIDWIEIQICEWRHTLSISISRPHSQAPSRSLQPEGWGHAGSCRGAVKGRTRLCHIKDRYRRGCRHVTGVLAFELRAYNPSQSNMTNSIKHKCESATQVTQPHIQFRLSPTHTYEKRRKSSGNIMLIPGTWKPISNQINNAYKWLRKRKRNHERDPGDWWPIIRFRDNRRWKHDQISQSLSNCHSNTVRRSITLAAISLPLITT